MESSHHYQHNHIEEINLGDIKSTNYYTWEKNLLRFTFYHENTNKIHISVDDDCD